MCRDHFEKSKKKSILSLVVIEYNRKLKKIKEKMLNELGEKHATGLDSCVDKTKVPIVLERKRNSRDILK